MSNVHGVAPFHACLGSPYFYTLLDANSGGLDARTGPIPFNAMRQGHFLKNTKVMMTKIGNRIQADHFM